MRCIFCHEKAGFFKRICPDCIKLGQSVQELPPSFSFNDLLNGMMATGATQEKIEKFLEADPYQEGSLRNQVTARMTNEVMAGLGIPSDMDFKGVAQVRKDLSEGKLPSFEEQEIREISQLKDYHRKI